MCEAGLEWYCVMFREFSLLLFPNDDIFAPGADFIIHSADGPKRVNLDSSVLYKGSLERKTIFCI